LECDRTTQKLFCELAYEVRASRYEEGEAQLRALASAPLNKSWGRMHTKYASSNPKAFIFKKVFIQ